MFKDIMKKAADKWDSVDEGAKDAIVIGTATVASVVAFSLLSKALVKQGFVIGYHKGVVDGYNYGMNDGYSVGWKDCNVDINWRALTQLGGEEVKTFDKLMAKVAANPKK